MDILKDDFCVDIRADLAKKQYNKAAEKLYNRFQHINEEKIHCDYYDKPWQDFVGYHNSNPDIGNEQWGKLINVETYINYVHTALGIKNHSIDNYSII